LILKREGRRHTVQADLSVEAARAGEPIAARLLGGLA
jgi:hypothetical protein